MTLAMAGFILFLLLNAFFVAAEFALMKVRESQLHAGDGVPARTRRKLALSLIHILSGGRWGDCSSPGNSTCGTFKFQPAKASGGKRAVFRGCSGFCQIGRAHV